MNSRMQTLGTLPCRIVDNLPAGEAPRLGVVLCHGFGAPATDLVPLARELESVLPDRRGEIQYIFPAAPLSLEAMGLPDGRAWWPLDMAKLNAAIETGAFRNLRNEYPAGLDQARGALMGVVDGLREASGLTVPQIVLGGFSQGAMLATDVALRLDEIPAGLGIFSGTLLCEDEWRRLADERGFLPVVQSHGRVDPLLPFAAAEWLRDLLSEAGMPVEFLPFDGPHTIPGAAIFHFGVLLHRLLGELDG